MLVADFVARCGILLQDANNVRWSEDELVRWLNDAQRATVMLRPEANAVTTVFSVDPFTNPVGLVNLPTDGVVWIDVIRNVSSGLAIKLIEKSMLDALDPAWSTVFGLDIKYWMYDLRNPKVFYFYPQMNANAQSGNEINAIYSAIPVDCISTSALAPIVAADAAAFAVLNAAEASAIAAGVPSPPSSYPPYLFLFGSAAYNAAVAYWTEYSNYYSVVYQETVAANLSRSTQLNDIYANALLEYVLYKAYSKDAEYSQAGGRAALHYQAFVTELGLNKSAESDASPSTALKKSIYPRN